MFDVDGNQYTDYDMGFGALFVGHRHPAVLKAIDAQLVHGTLFVNPCEANAEVAELLAARYGLPMWRFTNSGTESTMDAIRVARAATGRDKIVKVEGGYHGHHDEVMVSMKPPLHLAGPADAPNSVPSSAGISSSVVKDTIVIPYNDAAALERALASREVACFIVEQQWKTSASVCHKTAIYNKCARSLSATARCLFLMKSKQASQPAGVAHQVSSECNQTW